MKKTIPALLLLAALAACGPRSVQPPAEPARVGLATALSATNAAREAFISWDGDHQLTIVAGATSREDGEKKLADYRARRADVVAAFTLAYSSIAAAEVAFELREERSLALAREALASVLAVRSAVEQLRNGGR